MGLHPLRTTTPAADFCRPVWVDRSTPSPDSGTNGRSPEVSSTAFRTQPPNLQPVPLMDMGFAINCPLARHCMPRIRFLYIGSYVCDTPASFRPRLATTPLRFAMTSPPSGCQGDLHPQAVEHARHTTERGRLLRDGPFSGTAGRRSLEEELERELDYAMSLLVGDGSEGGSIHLAGTSVKAQVQVAAVERP